MRVPTSRLPFVLCSAAAVALVAVWTATASAQEASTIAPTSDAGAPSTTPPPPPSSPIQISARVRAAGRYYSVNGGPNASALDSAFGELRASGKVHDYVSVTLSLYATTANTSPCRTR